VASRTDGRAWLVTLRTNGRALSSPLVIGGNGTDGSRTDSRGPVGVSRPGRRVSGQRSPLASPDPIPAPCSGSSVPVCPARYADQTAQSIPAPHS